MVFFAKKIELPNFGEKIKKLREDAGLTQSKVAQLLNIQEKYIDFLEKGEIDKLPAAVYVKGFLRKYAVVLGQDSQKIVDDFVAEQNIARHLSGKKTESIRGLRKIVITPQLLRNLLIFGIIILIIGYFLWQLSFLLKAPSLEIMAPEKDLKVSNNEFVVKGKTEPGVTLTINNQEINLDKEGNFEQKIELNKGLNIIEIKAANRFGESSSLKRQIMLE